MCWAKHPVFKHLDPLERVGSTCHVLQAYLMLGYAGTAILEQSLAAKPVVYNYGRHSIHIGLLWGSRLLFWATWRSRFFLWLVAILLSSSGISMEEPWALELGL